VLPAVYCAIATDHQAATGSTRARQIAAFEAEGGRT
jgi:hypothetical protein